MSKYGIPSTTPPTEPGWYWHQFLSAAPVPYEVRWYGGKLCINNHELIEHRLALWWPIPIEVPEVPK